VRKITQISDRFLPGPPGEIDKSAVGVGSCGGIEGRHPGIMKCYSSSFVQSEAARFPQIPQSIIECRVAAGVEDILSCVGKASGSTRLFL
jgi:hypothetical protein